MQIRQLSEKEKNTTVFFFAKMIEMRINDETQF